MSVMRCEQCERTIDTDYDLGIWINAPALRGYDFFVCGPECADEWLAEHGFESMPEDYDGADVLEAKTKEANQ